MIMSRYRYRPVTVPLLSRDRPVTVLGPTLPTVTVLGPTLPNVTQRYTNVTDRFRPLLTVTEFYRYLRYKRYQRYRS
jgi:hypothetical protein